MKYGVLLHKHTSNFGDDIQAYAASLFLPQIDYMVDREYLNSFQSKNNEPVAMIFSAWWMWKKWNWPPNDCIVPKLVSIHLNQKTIRTSGTPVMDEMFKGIGADYLKAYGPVGCRDYHTLEKMKELGIDSYFSGCVTLTLPKMKKKYLTKEYICLVDIDENTENFVKKQLEGTNIDIKIMSHDCDYRNSDATWNERAKKVEEFLTIYQNAKCVITRRLHVSLPCLALEVPVLCLINNKKSDRFAPYTEYLNLANAKEFRNGEVDYDITNPPKNKDVYKATRESLKKDITEFIKSTRKMDNKIESLNKVNYSELEKLKWQNELMNFALDKWFVESRELLADYRFYKKEYEKLLKNQKKEEKVKSKIKSFMRKVKRKIKKSNILR